MFDHFYWKWTKENPEQEADEKVSETNFDSMSPFWTQNLLMKSVNLYLDFLRAARTLAACNKKCHPKGEHQRGPPNLSVIAPTPLLQPSLLAVGNYTSIPARGPYVYLLSNLVRKVRWSLGYALTCPYTIFQPD